MKWSLNDFIYKEHSTTEIEGDTSANPAANESHRCTIY